MKKLFKRIPKFISIMLVFALLVSGTVVNAYAEKPEAINIQNTYNFQQSFTEADYQKAAANEHFFDELSKDDPGYDEAKEALKKDPLYVSLKDEIIKLAIAHGDENALKYTYEVPEDFALDVDGASKKEINAEMGIDKILDAIIENMGCYLYWENGVIDYSYTVEKNGKKGTVKEIIFQFYVSDKEQVSYESEGITVNDNGIISDGNGNKLIPWDKVDPVNNGDNPGSDDSQKDNPEGDIPQGDDSGIVDPDSPDSPDAPDGDGGQWVDPPIAPEPDDDSNKGNDKPGTPVDGDKDKVLTLKDIKDRCGDTLVFIMDSDGEHILFVGGNFSDKKVNSEESALAAIKQMKNLIGLEDSMILKCTTVTQAADGTTYYRFAPETENTIDPNSYLVLGVDKDGAIACLVAPDSENYAAYAQDEYKLADKDSIEEYFQESFAENGFTPVDGNVTIEYYEPMQQLCYMIKGYDAQGRYFKQYFSTANEKEKGCASIEYYESKEAMESEDVEPFSYLINQDVTVTPTEFTDYFGNTVTLPVAYDAAKGKYFLLDKERNIIGIDGTGSNDLTAPEIFYFDDPATLQANCKNYISAFYNISVSYDYYKELGVYAGDKVTRLTYYPGNNIPNASASYYSDSIWIQVNDNPIIANFDVVSHELTHAVYAMNSVDTPYKNAVGAINESFADICGNVLEMMAKRDGRIPNNEVDMQWWLIGESTGSEQRCMESPDAFYQAYVVNGINYVQALTESYSQDDHGGVHLNSGILNNIAYRLWDEAGLSYEEIFGIFTKMQYLATPEIDFTYLDEYAKYVMQKLGYESAKIAQVQNIMNEAGINNYDSDKTWATTEVAGEGNVKFVITFSDKEYVPDTMYYVGAINAVQDGQSSNKIVYRDNDGNIGVASAPFATNYLQLALIDKNTNVGDNANMYLQNNNVTADTQISVNALDAFSAAYAQSNINKIANGVQTSSNITSMVESTQDVMSELILRALPVEYNGYTMKVTNLNADSNDTAMCFYSVYNTAESGYEVFLRNTAKYNIELVDNSYQTIWSASDWTPEAHYDAAETAADGRKIINVSYGASQLNSASLQSEAIEDIEINVDDSSAVTAPEAVTTEVEVPTEVEYEDAA